jgi:hypothetical protein
MKQWPAILAALVLAGCSNGASPLPSLTTGSLFGSSDAAKVATDPQLPANTSANRAFRVGSVSARAAKCGFNFDVGKMKSTWLAYEAQAGTGVEDLAKAEKMYTVSYNGTMRVAVADANYCNDAKTREIKGDLAMLLAGDYTPQVIKVKSDDDDDSLIKFGSTQMNNPFQ